MIPLADWGAGPLTAEQAADVRRMRVDEGYSWRQVASHTYDWWPATQHLQGNQLWGMAVCEAAAQTFGEHYLDDIWNSPT